MIQNPRKKSVFQKQIPTMVGLFVLVVALVGGVMIIGNGAGVFAPRASAETTPKNIRVSNVTDSSFTVSFLTEGDAIGFVKYGVTPDKLSSQSSDDRDQLTGSVGQYKTHHITVRGINPNTQYYYVLGTGSGATFDNAGTSFAIKTAQRGGAPSAAKTAYGTVLTASGTPADGSIVYISIPNVGEMSSLVKATGSWAIPLSNARNADGSGYAPIGDEDVMSILIQGIQVNASSQFVVPVSESQPVASVTLGQTPETTASTTLNTQLATDSATMAEDSILLDPNADPLASATGGGLSELGLTSSEQTQATNSSSLSQTATNSGALATAISGSTSTLSGTLSTAQSTTNSGGVNSLASQATQSVPEKTILNLEDTTPQVLTTSNPIIVGKAKPNVIITIQVNSETQINQQLTANSTGEFELDIAKLSEELEPGEHSVTYSYTDPDTGQVITKTVKFTVAPKTTNTGGSTQIAQTNTGTSGSTTQSQPFGSGNPVPVGSQSTSLSATSSATATSSGTATNSAKGGATRSALPSTSSAIPVSGSVGTTFALVLGGIFFILAGAWSFWLAHEIERV